MKQISLFLLGIQLALLSLAQTQPPKGPAADKVVKAFSEGKLDELVAALPALVKGFPAHPYTIFFRAYVADRQDNNVNEALKGYTEVIKLAPDVMEAYFFRAIIFNEKGMYQKAIDDMTNAIKYDTERQSHPYTLRGEIYMNAEKAEEAFQDFKKAISLSPANAGNYRGLLNAGLSIDKAAEVQSVIRQAVEGSESGNPQVWEVWGDCHLRTKQFEQANKAYDQAMALPGAAPTADSYNSAAIAAMNMRDFIKAKRLAEKAVAANPAGYLYYCTRSEISVYDRTWEEVYTWAQKALQVNEKSARANKLMAIGVKFTNRGQSLSDEYDKKSKQYEAEGYQ